MLAKRGGDFAPGVHSFPRELDEAVAHRKLKAMGVEIDALSAEQIDYLGV
jgi:adenosylhomocysteinase